MTIEDLQVLNTICDADEIPAHRAGLSLNVLWLAHRDDVGQRGLWMWPEVVDGWYDEAEED